MTDNVQELERRIRTAIALLTEIHHDGDDAVKLDQVLDELVSAKQLVRKINHENTR